MHGVGGTRVLYAALRCSALLCAALRLLAQHACNTQVCIITATLSCRLNTAIKTTYGNNKVIIKRKVMPNRLADTPQGVYYTMPYYMQRAATATHIGADFMSPKHEAFIPIIPLDERKNFLIENSLYRSFDRRVNEKGTPFRGNPIRFKATLAVTHRRATSYGADFNFNGRVSGPFMGLSV
ncbi:hypothetical protein HZH68_000590 [Vespula germanica]|uniref:Uncharacterized protein n=1 Tax=Vespula germanica TaxID=30212 RepID=A0A834NTX5_VESGE|nr:hypothetical protein HZH68_000590 [Vespula germanica]